MRRDRLLLTEIVDAVERIVGLAEGRSLDDFESDRDRRDALLWNFTVLGEAVGQLSDATKDAHPGIAWMAPVIHEGRQPAWRRSSCSLRAEVVELERRGAFGFCESEVDHGHESPLAIAGRVDELLRDRPMAGFLDQCEVGR